jgi:hypothetical protein
MRPKSGYLSRLLNNLFFSRLREIPFIVFLSFLLTFIITRIYLFLGNHDILDVPGPVLIHGVHVHHLSWGIFILAIVGFWSLVNLHPRAHRLLAVFYGIGLGLTFDEFALWLNLKDDYYARITYDAIVTIALVLLNIIYFPGFWSRMEKRTLYLARRLYGLFHLPDKFGLRKSRRLPSD